jgi:hypothetical protein
MLIYPALLLISAAASTAAWFVSSSNGMKKLTEYPHSLERTRKPAPCPKILLRR